MPSHKTPNPGPEHSREREFTTLLEEVRSQFRAFGEGLTDVQEKVSSISNRLEQLEGEFSLFRISMPSIVSDVRNIQSNYASKKDIESLTAKLSTIVAKVENLATKKDLEKFVEESNKRLTALEAR